MGTTDVMTHRHQHPLDCEEKQEKSGLVLNGGKFPEIPLKEPSEDTDEIAPPDGGYGWVVVFASFLSSFILDGIIYAFSPFLEILIIEFDQPRSYVAWIGSLTAGAAFLSGPLVSTLANRYGLRPVCIIGALLASLGTASTMLANSIEFLMITQGVLAGIGFGAIYLPAIVIVGIYFEKKRTFANGIAVCGSSLGSFVFPPLIYFLINEYGWKGTNLILSGIILNCCWLGGLMKPLKKKKKKKKKELDSGVVSGNGINDLYKIIKEIPHSDDENCESKLLNQESDLTFPTTRKEKIPYAAIDEKEKKETLKEKILKDLDVTLFKNVTFLMVIAAHFCAFLAFYTPFLYLPAAAMQKGIDQNSATFLISIIGITNAIGRIVSGAFAALPSVNPIWVHNVCLMAAGTALIFTRFASSYGSFACIACIFGAAMSTYISLTSPILVNVFGVDKLSNTFGFIILFWGISSLIGAPLSGKISEMTGSFDASFYYSGTLIWCCALLFCCVPLMERLQSKNKSTKSGDERLQSPMSVEETI